VNPHDTRPPHRSTGAPSVLASWARTIIRALDARGLDGRGLAAEVGIDLRQLTGAEARCSMTATAELWRRAVHETGDPCFGIYVSRFVTYTTFHALGAAVLASSTLREGFQRLVRYSRMIGDSAAPRLEAGDDRVRLVLEVTGTTRPPDEAIDALLALVVRVARLLRDNRALAPLRLELQRAEPSPSEPFRRFFRAPIAFRTRANVIVFSADDADARLPTGNAELARRIDEVVARYVARLDDQRILHRVRAAVIDRLPDGEPAQRAVARAVGMSPRTLQRRLAAEGASYQAILAETRADLARSYLAAGWSVTDTAFTLGFADANSFSRAFRRWTGVPPSAHSHTRV
jgi:AraC-like DNA-binding protein